jgi:hypothetical protein
VVFPNTVVGKTSTAVLKIKNQGSGNLIGSVTAPPAPFGISGSGSFNLASGAIAAITLTYSPLAVRTTTKPGTIMSNSLSNNPTPFKLQGTGTP